VTHSKLAFVAGSLRPNSALRTKGCILRDLWLTSLIVKEAPSYWVLGTPDRLSSPPVVLFGLKFLSVVMKRSDFVTQNIALWNFEKHQTLARVLHGGSRFVYTLPYSVHVSFLQIEPHGLPSASKVTQAHRIHSTVHHFLWRVHKIAKNEYQLRRIRPSVRPSTWINSTPIGRILTKFDI
jgi:hypothetical protein